MDNFSQMKTVIMFEENFDIVLRERTTCQGKYWNRFFSTHNILLSRMKKQNLANKYFPS